MHKISAYLLRSFLLIISFAICTISHAQQRVEMADAMRANGKIYVVVTVCVTILVGLFLYVFSIDRKLSKIEKDSASQ